MKLARILAGLLAGLMLCGSMVAYGKGDEIGETATSSSLSENEESDELSDWLPALDYGKDEVTILSRYREGWTSGEISVEGQNGEPVNDAVYDRNRIVEERLNVKLKSVLDHDDNPQHVIDLIKMDVAGGPGEYDILASACFVMLNESLSGTFANLRNLEYIDFDKPWWSQGFNEAIEYKGLQYGVTGSAVLSMYRFAFVTLFNKDLFDDAQVPYLYDKVRDGSWTLDYQNSIVTTFHQDKNGDGKQDKDGDVFGLTTSAYISVDAYWSACDIPILAKNEDDGYDFVFGEHMKRLDETCDKLMKMYYKSGGATYVFDHYGLDQEQDDIRDMFAEGRAAMATLRLMALESAVVRDMKQLYGVVPMPKFDETQKEYKTLLHDQFTVLAVPTTVTGKRLDEIGAVMEAMCSESYKRVRPAYYDTTLRSKLISDPDSAEMLDLLIGNIYIDAGIVYTSALSSFHDAFRQIMTSKGTKKVASEYTSTTKKTKNALNTMTKKLDALVDRDVD